MILHGRHGSMIGVSNIIYNVWLKMLTLHTLISIRGTQGLTHRSSRAHSSSPGGFRGALFKRPPVIFLVGRIPFPSLGTVRSRPSRDRSDSSFVPQLFQLILAM